VIEMLNASFIKAIPFVEHCDCWPDEGKLREILLISELLAPIMAVPLLLLMLFVSQGWKLFGLLRDSDMRYSVSVISSPKSWLWFQEEEI
jgi:hypothetical protein